MTRAPRRTWSLLLFAWGCAHPGAPVPPPELESHLARVRGAAHRLERLVALQGSARAYLGRRERGPNAPTLIPVVTRSSWEGDGGLVLVQEGPDGPRAAFEARVLDGLRAMADFRAITPPRPLVDEELVAWQARSNGLRALGGAICGFAVEDVVVVPDPTGAALDAYAIPVLRLEQAPKEQITIFAKGQPPMRSSAGKVSVVAMGHRRAHLSADGGRVLGVEELSGGCRVEAVELGWAEVMDLQDPSVDVPNEVQVMLSKVIGRTLRMTTRRGRWELVEGELVLTSLER